MKSNYDQAWKLILEKYFQSLLELFVPEAARCIDWQKPHDFLDKELTALHRQAAIGNKLADKLVKIFTIDGNEAYVLIHVEVQGAKEKEFSARMFEYYYRIYDKHRKPVLSLAILTDLNRNWRPAIYEQSLWGCQLSLKYPIIKLIDFEGKGFTPEIEKHPFGPIIKAHLAAIRTRCHPQLRYEQKVNLVKKLYPLGFSGDDIRALYDFIDRALDLPEVWEEEYMKAMKQYEEANDIELMSPTERYGYKRGIQENLQKVEESLQKVEESQRETEENRQKAEQSLQLSRKFALVVLEKKFGRLPAPYKQKIAKASLEELVQIDKYAETATQIEEVFTGEISII